MAAIVGAMGAVNIAKIAGVEMEDGGMITGARHTQGGVDINAEGGEVMFSRKAVDYWGANNLLDMNRRGTYKVDGGMVSAPNETQQLSNGTIQQLAMNLNNIKVVNDPVEALQAQDEAIFIEQNGDV